jgi:acyl-CoA synthetase (AMP-forming)/AMP-acid ligase II
MAQLDQNFRVITDLIHQHAQQAPERVALRDDTGSLTYGELDARMDRVAAALQRDGLGVGDAIAICGYNTVDYAVVFLGALRAGLAVAPLAPGSAPDSFSRMLRDAQARVLFADASAPVTGTLAGDVQRVSLESADDDSAPTLAQWLAPQGARPQPVTIAPDAPFNIIYSSGTTGEPKGIVQPHSMRWTHVCRASKYGYGPESTALLSTALYSNTTLVVFFPTLAFGGCATLMGKFDAARYLALAQSLRVTHTMLVPVQYRRLMALPAFDSFDLSAFRFKFCTSAPFGADLKADVLARWPGGLVEFYGMTEGGGTCILDAHLHPHKLHTVGRPAEGHDIRLIDDAGNVVPAGEAGEVVGHSGGMMKGYHGQPERTREAEWFDPSGKRFIRTGDIGRFDADGFLTLFDRKKDMIISGGFNIYPSDLEAVLRQHPGVDDVAVVGMPSDEWGETPVAFVVRRAGDATTEAALREWANAQVGKTQRLNAVMAVPELPRSPIGKVLKRELRDHALAQAKPTP